MSISEARRRVIADTELQGSDLTRELASVTDGWLRSLFREATGSTTASGLCLVATGGYGRGELFPYSDLDLLLLHDPEIDPTEVAERLWYPIWDQGLKLGHAVRTGDQTLAMASDDLDTATALLQMRVLAGDAELAAGVQQRLRQEWSSRGEEWLDWVSEGVERRHLAGDEVAFLLEPDLKEDRGGLRDIHALAWADLAWPVLDEVDHDRLDVASEILERARVGLHRVAGRPGDRLLLQVQDAVAESVGYDDADALMADVSSAGRAIAWISDQSWRKVRARHRQPLPSAADRVLAPGVLMRDEAVHVVADPARDPAVALRAAAAAAVAGTPIDRASLELLADKLPEYPDPWPAEARSSLVRLLSQGRAAISVLESLDQVGVLARILPEWEPVRSRPQRNAYHRFTVDRHLHETAAEAAKLAPRVARPDLLLVGAWLHDLGKGYPGDHTRVGMDLMAKIAERMGFPARDVDTLVRLVEHHLLLPDVATRRDLSDEATLMAVAEQAGDRTTLELLHRLTEADSRATGPAAWGTWKKGLVDVLAERAAQILAGEDVEPPRFPDQSQLDAMRRGTEMIHGSGDLLTVLTRDRPGVFARVAGALALSELKVQAADAHSEFDMALSVFRVQALADRPDWDAVADLVTRALEGRLALDARIALRASEWRPRRAVSARPVLQEVTVDQSASGESSVVEVRGADRVGLLYDLARTFADMDIDIGHAKIQTLGHEVVDSFYVTAPGGGKLTDEVAEEVRLALTHALERRAPARSG